MIKITVNDKSIELSEDEFEFFKKFIVGDSIDFINEGFADIDCPIDLFDDEIGKYRGDFFNNLKTKLKEIF